MAFLGAAAHPGLVVAGRRRDFASTINKLFIGYHGKIFGKILENPPSMDASSWENMDYLGFAEDDL